MYAAFMALRATVRWLPLSIAQALGACAGWAGYAIAGRSRQLVWDQLTEAFGPRLSDRTRSYVARRVFTNLGRLLPEWFVLDRMSPAEIERFVEVHGLGHLARALERGRGVIMITAHFGNWEVLAMTLVTKGFTGGVLARPLRYPEYQRFLWEMRRRKGVPTYERGSLKDVARVLAQNQIIGMMPDQDMDSLDGIFVECFNRPTYTPIGPAALALMTGAALLPTVVIRRGRRFRLVIDEPIAIERTGERRADLERLTQLWSRRLESYIRCYPEQWAWIHRRWKTQPQAVASGQWPVDGNRQLSDEKTAARPEINKMAHAVVSVFLLVLLITGYWSLVTVLGCSKAPTKPAAVESPVPPANESVDHSMAGFTLAGFGADGSKRWDLEGSGAVAEGPVVTVRDPSGIGYSHAEPSGRTAAQPTWREEARTTHLTASLAHINQTNHRIRLEHDVVVHTSDGLWLYSPWAYWLSDESTLETDAPVRIESEHMLLRGRGAVAHSDLEQVVIQRDVELVLNPASDEPPGEVQHVQITCDGPLSFDYDQSIATFEQNVHIKDAQGDLYSDTLVAYIDQRTRTIRYAEATGNVRIVQGTHTAHSERAVYEPARRKITLLGSPSLLVMPDGAMALPTVALSSSSPLPSAAPSPLAASSSPPPESSAAASIP